MSGFAALSTIVMIVPYHGIDDNVHVEVVISTLTAVLGNLLTIE